MMPFAFTTQQKAKDCWTPIPVFSDHVSTVTEPLESIQELFTFSPFGLRCRQCIKCVTIQLDERCIRDHLKKTWTG
jgi:hypothetical protein